MTNREKILLEMGDMLIANILIECVRAYRTKEELRSHNPHIEYKFNKQIYRDFDAAFKAVKEWLDEEECVCGCVHPEDTWTKWWCGDCGAYANYSGCRGPRGAGKDN